MADKLDQQLLLAYVEGELKPRDAARVEAVLRDDPRLGRLIEQMMADRDALRAMPDPPAPDWLMEEVDRQLERDMLMEDMPVPVEAAVGRQRHVLRTIFASSAVAAMLAIVSGLIFFSISDVTPQEFASRFTEPQSQETQRPAVASAERFEEAEAESATADTADADAAEDASPTAGALAQQESAPPPAVADSSDTAAAAMSGGGGVGGAGQGLFEPRAELPPSVSPHLDPSRRDADALLDSSFDRAADTQLSSSDQLAEARLSPRLRVDLSDPFAAEPELMREAADAAEAIAQVDQPSPFAPQHQALRAEVDPSALTPPDDGLTEAPPTQLPGTSAVLSQPAPALDIPPHPAEPTLTDRAMTLARGGADASLTDDPAARIEGFARQQQAVGAERGVAFDVDPTDANLRALLDQSVLAHELQLRIEADRETALEHLRAAGKLPQPPHPEQADADQPATEAHRFELQIPLEKVQSLIDALRQDERVASVVLRPQHVLAAGQLPGAPKRDSHLRDLWPSLVPDYEAILDRRLPRKPETTIALPVRLIEPTPEPAPTP